MTEPAAQSRSPAETLPTDVAEARATLPPAELRAIERMVTEDDTPVDSFFTDSQRRLLASPLFSSWKGNGRPFMACADVGIFRTPSETPLVPDLFLSLDVTPFNDMRFPEGRSYCIWYYKNAPDIAIEIDTKEVERETLPRFDRYAHFGVRYLATFRPSKPPHEAILRVYELTTATYVERAPHPLPDTGLGLKLWQGEFERMKTTWLRWHDESGALIPTGEERANQAHKVYKQAKMRIEQARAKINRLTGH